MESKKEKEISVSQRQIYILSLLSENVRGYQIEEIRNRLLQWNVEVSKRTIARDIDELSLHYGIGEEERGGKTYYYADKYTLRNVDFTIEDLVSLAFAKEMLKQVKHLHMGQHAINCIDKIVKQSAELNQLQFEAFESHFKQAGLPENLQDDVAFDVEKKIQRAIDNANKIQIEYYSFSSDESTVRVVHPYRLILIDSYLNMEGYCELRKEVRRFRLSRMQNIKVLDETFNWDDEQKLVKNQEGNLLTLNGGRIEELELVFTGESVRYVKEYDRGRGQRKEEKADGLHFYSKTAIAPDVVRWIRGFGSEVQVVKPDWLATELREDAKRIVEKSE